MRWTRIIIFILMLLLGAMMVAARGQEFRPFPSPPGQQVLIQDYLGYDINDLWNWTYQSHLSRYYERWGTYRCCWSYPYRAWYMTPGSFEPNHYWRRRVWRSKRSGYRNLRHK